MLILLLATSMMIAMTVATVVNAYSESERRQSVRVRARSGVFPGERR